MSSEERYFFWLPLASGPPPPSPEHWWVQQTRTWKCETVQRVQRYLRFGECAWAVPPCVAAHSHLRGTGGPTQIPSPWSTPDGRGSFPGLMVSASKELVVYRCDGNTLPHQGL